MAENKNIFKNKKLLIIIISAAVLIIALGITAMIIFVGKTGDNLGNPSNTEFKYLEDGKLIYDDSAIILNPDNDSWHDREQPIEKVQDGYISISHKSEAVSTDGENFECYIQNGIENQYDMFINIYKDNTAQEQLLLTGLIPPGSGIDHFQSEIKLEPGTYDALLVITQVEDDHETLHNGQLFLALHLTVI